MIAGNGLSRVRITNLVAADNRRRGRSHTLSVEHLTFTRTSGDMSIDGRYDWMERPGNIELVTQTIPSGVARSAA